MQSEVARRAGNGIQSTLSRLASLIGGLVMMTAAVGVATFATGWWVFHHGVAWIIVGGMLCALPVLAAALGWLYVRDAARQAPRLIDDITSFLRTPSQGAEVLIDYDTGQTITMSAKRFTGLKNDISGRKVDLPSLWAGVRAVTVVPALAALSVLGMLAIGALGTILLIIGLAR